MPRRGRRNLGSEVASREAVIKEWPCGRHKLLFWTKAMYHTWYWVAISRAKRSRNYVSLANAGSSSLGFLRSTGWGLGRWAPGHLGTP